MVAWCTSLVWLIAYTGEERGYWLALGHVAMNDVPEAPYEPFGWSLRPLGKVKYRKAILAYPTAFRLTPPPGDWVYKLPLWVPFVIVGIPTAALWRRDRRFPAGHCQSCGYDLTGNKSGVCPECGCNIGQEIT